MRTAKLGGRARELSPFGVEEAEVVEQARFPDFLAVAPEHAERAPGVQQHLPVGLRVGRPRSAVDSESMDLCMRSVASLEQRKGRIDLALRLPSLAGERQ